MLIWNGRPTILNIVSLIIELTGISFPDCFLICYFIAISIYLAHYISYNCDLLSTTEGNLHQEI